MTFHQKVKGLLPRHQRVITRVPWEPLIKTLSFSSVKDHHRCFQTASIFAYDFEPLFPNARFHLFFLLALEILGFVCHEINRKCNLLIIIAT